MSILEVKNICKSLGHSGALNDLSFNINKGEKIVIMSSENNEKSMLLRLLKGLETPDSGEIFFDGQPLTPENKKNKIGMFTQDFHLFSNMNVLDNLCLAPVELKGINRRKAEAKAREWLSKAGLTEKAKKMPERLSEGQRQRAAICRTLMTEPELMLFDDPENPVDPNVTDEICTMIRMLAKHDMTMIIASGEINFIKDVADRVIFLSDGKIYEEGTPEKILNNPEREKTAEFVRKLKCFNYKFESCDFDLIELQSKIQRFAEKYGLNKKYANRLQICVEELVYEMLFGSCKYAEKIDLALEVSYSGTDNSVVIDLKGKGTKFNPFDDENEGEGKLKNVHLGVTMLRKIAKKISYDFNENENINHLFVIV